MASSGPPPPSQQEVCSRCGQRFTDADEKCPACGDPRDAPTIMSQAKVLDGKWVLEEELGRGGMSTVYLAADLELDRKVAIKMMNAALCDDESVVSRFEREAKMMAQLEHPNLVPIYAIGRKGNIPFLVMKRLEGSTMGEHLRQHGRLPVSEMLHITRQVCAGLSFLHSNGVIHRDIKPANIFLGPDGHVTVLDLGVAHDARNSMTRLGMMVGTPRYMSPEQVVGIKVDHRSDLYSLGTVLYEMASGAPMFDAESDFSVMKAHTDQEPPNLAGIADLPGTVAAVIMRALAKDPATRFQSAAEFAAEFQSAAQVSLPADGFPSIRPQRASLPPAPTQATQVPAQTRRLDTTNLQPLTPLPSEVRSAATPAPFRRSQPSGKKARSKSASTNPPAKPERWQRWPLVLGAVSALSLIALGLTLAWPTSGFQKPEQVPEVPAAEAAMNEPDPNLADPTTEPPSGPDGPVAEAPPADPGKPVVAERPAAPAPPHVPARRTSSRHTAPKPGSPAPARPTELIVNATQGGSISWAWLDVDGIRQGSTPKKVALAPGSHSVTLERPGFRKIKRKISLEEGESQKLNLELEPM